MQAATQAVKIGGQNELPLTLLVLVGLIGSGKSTLAVELESQLGWLRCNQDDLQGDRRLVEAKVAEGFAQGRNIVVDRTNFDAQQRAHWLRLANASGREVRRWCLFLDISKPVCRDRLTTRENHPTIHSAEQAYGILDRFSHHLRPPTANEGFDKVLRVTINPGLDRESLLEVLKMVDEEGEKPTERQTTLDGSLSSGAGGGGGGGSVQQKATGWAALGAGNTLGGA